MRATLVKNLAYALRYAENAFLNSGYSDDSDKQAVFAQIMAAELTPDEYRELWALCESMGL